MSGKPEDAAKRDVAALTRELVGQIDAISAFSSSGLVAARFRAGRQGASTGVPAFDGPKAMLENAGRFVSPALPAGASLRPVKASLLRILRIVTRDQTTFNSALLEALREALFETEAALREAAARRESEVEDLSAELSREAAAREDAGRELAATQLRMDAFEGDRDRRFEALARRQEREDAGAVALSEGLRALKLEWASLRGELRDVSGAAARGGREGPDAGRAAVVRADDPLRAGLYVDFEERFRGSEAAIRERQRGDAARFQGAPGPVADLGCGRGEFLEALRAGNIAGIGCDANPVMAARAREKRLAVDQADLFTWLAARQDGSLGGVAAFQVVEHLPPASLFDLVELAVRKLAPGGRVLFETINPESVYAMRWFWMDLTHVRPVPAPSLAQLLTASGLRDVLVDFRSPVPESEGLPAGLAEDPRFAPLARLLFAPQDYAVTGVK